MSPTSAGFRRSGPCQIPDIEGAHGGADPLLLEDFVNFLRGKPTVGATRVDG